MLRSLTTVVLCLAVIAGLGETLLGGTVALWRFDEKAPGQQADGTPGAILDSEDGHSSVTKFYVLSIMGNPVSYARFLERDVPIKLYFLNS